MILLKVLGFSLALALVFTLVANTLPQVEGEAPEEIEVELGALTMDSFVALGEELFKGKGTCTLCHNNLGRAPDILALNMAQTAQARLEDTRYQGAATDVESYFRESMIEPSVYVVKGYGKKGTNDAVSPMPNSAKPPIQLSEIQIDAIIAYMQAKDGNPVTVSLPTQAPETATAAGQPQPAAEASPVAPAQDAETALTKHACTACHAVLESQSPVGPGLTDVGARLTRGEIRQSIVDPNAVIAQGFAPNMMPPDLADRMTARELEMIVDFLYHQKGG